MVDMKELFKSNTEKTSEAYYELVKFVIDETKKAKEKQDIASMEIYETILNKINKQLSNID